MDGWGLGRSVHEWKLEYFGRAFVLEDFIECCLKNVVLNYDFYVRDYINVGVHVRLSFYFFVPPRIKETNFYGTVISSFLFAPHLHNLPHNHKKYVGSIKTLL